MVSGRGSAHEYMYWEHAGYSAIRKGDWKGFKKVTDTQWQLYDLRTDRDEQIDVAKDQPEIVKDFNEKWGQWAVSHQVLPKK